MLSNNHIANTKPPKYLSVGIWIIMVLALGAFKHTYHELWKDEWQAWFVARDMSFGKMFGFLQYEGHPGLWYIYLKIMSPLSYLIGDISTINLSHLLTVAGGLYFLIVRFKLPLFLKVLIASTYFVGFEYGIINRGYFLVILLTFWSVDIIARGSKKPYLLGLILFLLCQTEVYGVFIAVCFAMYVWLKDGSKLSWFSTPTGKWLIAGGLIFLISVFPRESGHIGKTQSKDLNTFEKLGVAFQGNLTNTYLIGATDDTARHGATQLGLLIAVGVAMGLYFVMRKDRHLLITLATYICIAIIFSTLFFLGGVRQWGIGFILFIGLLELRGLDIKENWMPTLIATVFAIFGVVHGFKAFSTDGAIPFTNAKECGEFIAKNVPVKVPIVAMSKFESTPVIGYAGRKFFELPDGKEFTYFRWLDKIYLPNEGELHLFAKFKNVGGIVLISPKPIDDKRFPNAKLWDSFTTNNYKNENYYLYMLKRNQ